MKHDPFDKSLCSFPVPDFTSEQEEIEWFRSLTVDQGFEIMSLMNLYRWGEEAMNRPMDLTSLRVMTIDEVRERDAQEAAEDERWRAEHGLPPRCPSKQQRMPS